MSSEPATRRNVILTGFMGTGKTTTGRILAARLGYEFVDTDAIIEDAHGPIPEIFRTRGEVAFRDLEHDVAVELSERRGLVISTGGRLMVDDANAALLGATGDVFCLTAAVDTILARVTAEDAMSGRPLLDTHDDAHTRVAELLADRAAAYGRFRQVETDTRSPDAVADEIMRALAAPAD